MDLSQLGYIFLACLQTVRAIKEMSEKLQPRQTHEVAKHNMEKDMEKLLCYRGVKTVD